MKPNTLDDKLHVSQQSEIEKGEINLKEKETRVKGIEAKMENWIEVPGCSKC